MMPTIFIDGTFQCGAANGTIVICSTISGNRTIIPLAYGWGTSENQEIITMRLSLIHRYNQDISTIISDGGTAIATSVRKVFHEALHQLCAWHISAKIKKVQARILFWKLAKCKHPISYQRLSQEFQMKYPDISSSLIKNK